MVDIEGLERLARLREQGVLTDEEFETEKSKLLGQRNGDEIRHEYQEDPPRRIGKIIGWTLVVALLAVTAPLIFGNFLPETSSAPAASASSTNDSAWEFSTSTDPMSDATIVTASRRIDAGQHYVDAEIRCADSTALEYELTISPKDGSSDSIDYQIGLYGGGRFYTLRLDSAEAVRAATNSRYSNVISTRSTDSVGFSSNDSQKMAAARTLTFQVPMQHSDLTFELPQRDRQIREFLEGCRKVDPNENFVPSEPEEVPQASADDTAVSTEQQEEVQQQNALSTDLGSSEEISSENVGQLHLDNAQ